MLRSKIECAISEGAESSSDELAHSVCVISILGRELTANFDLLIIKGKSKFQLIVAMPRQFAANYVSLCNRNNRR